MKTLFAIVLCFFSAISSAEMKTITEIYEASSARLEKVGTSQPIVSVKICDNCVEKKLNLASNVKIIYQKTELSQQDYIMNYSRFKGFMVSHDLPSNSVILINAH